MRTRAWRRHQIEVHLNRRLRQDRATHTNESVPHYIEELDWEVSEDRPDDPWSTCKGKNFSVYYIHPVTTSRHLCPCFYDQTFISQRFKEQPQTKVDSGFNRDNKRELTRQERRARAGEQDQY